MDLLDAKTVRSSHDRSHVAKVHHPFDNDRNVLGPTIEYILDTRFTSIRHVRGEQVRQVTRRKVSPSYSNQLGSSVVSAATRSRISEGVAVLRSVNPSEK